MIEDANMEIEVAEEHMDAAIEHLDKELGSIRAGKASATMLSNVYVDYYGTITPIAQIGNINTPDGRTITIQPWEKNMVQPIEKALLAANLGMTPNNDGITIRLNIPALTEERRKELVKQVKAAGEHAKIAIRNVRQQTKDKIKKMLKTGLSEDQEKDCEARLQILTNNYIAQADKVIAAKDKEIMSI